MADAQPTTDTPSNPAQTGQTNIQVNLDYLKTTRVHMCMPCYGGQLTESTFMSYIKWANTARQLGHVTRSRPSSCTPKTAHT